MLDQTTIDEQQALLLATRRRLAYRVRQQARLGDYAPPDVALDVEDARAQIAQIKGGLRAIGVAIVDEPNDEPNAALPPAVAPGALEQRNRERMLQKVRDFWVRGVLERSLHGAALIALGLEQRPDAVVHPWDALIQQFGHDPQPIPAGTPIAEVFDKLGGELLILGTPGAGKTTMLLELARALLERAALDASQPMPVVFNLSSWAERRRPLADWLVDELNQRYDIPRKIGRMWVEHDLVLPLLDGLDEVQQGYREACVEAINVFRREHGLVSLAICSRVADYQALSMQLRLQGAVLLQPLTSAQIDAYLTGAGDQLAVLRAAMAEDAALRELAESPLMLSIMTLAYQGALPGALAASGTPAERRGRLFDAYVERMFARRGLETRYTPEQTVRWLAWLASRMQQRAQSVFLIERLQPTWLSTRTARVGYTIVDRLGWGLLFGSICGLAVGVITGIQVDGARGLEIGLACGLVVGLLLGLFGGEPERTAGVQRTIWRVAGSAILGYLVVGSAIGLENRLVTGSPLGIARGLVFGLFGGVAAALSGGPGLWPRHIVVIEALRWSWFNMLRSMLGGLTFGLLIGLLVGAIFDIGFGLVIGGVFGLLLGLVAGLWGGLTSSELAVKTTPNQGVLRSGRSAALIGLGSGLFVGLLIGAIYWLGSGLVPAVRVGLLFGLVSGISSALVFGGYGCLSHLALRLIFWRGGAMPWNYARFLDSCAERILLRKVGGGYIFVHRLLMEYFATLAPPKL